MLLAVATMFFQISAVPQSAVSLASEMNLAANAEQTNAETTHPSTRLEANAYSSAGSGEASQETAAAMPVSFMPGRTTLELAPAPRLTPALPAAVSPAYPAFVQAIEPADTRAREAKRRQLWLTLSIAQHGAAALDAWSTRRALSSGKAREMNPLMRPFAKNNSIYAAIQVGPLLTDYVSRRMMHSENIWLRHTWWLPQVLGTAASIASGFNNLQFHN